MKMNTLNILRKPRLCEHHVNLFANGRMGAIYAIAFAMLAVLSLASCSSDDDNEDKVEQVTIYVAEDTGVYYDCGSIQKKKTLLKGCRYGRIRPKLGRLSVSIR